MGSIKTMGQITRDSINYAIPSLEEFAYPFQNLNYISPRFIYRKNPDGSSQSTFLIRTVFTIPKLPVHFRLEVPFISDKAMQNTEQGLGDISFRSVFVFPQKKRFLTGFSLKVIMPTSGNAQFGAGDFQLDPEIGFLKVFPYSKGSIGLSTDYQFSVGANKFDKPETAIWGISPTIDYWGNNILIGYYPTYTYNLKSGKWQFPFDVEFGYQFIRKWWVNVELTLPDGTFVSNNYEIHLKLRHHF